MIQITTASNVILMDLFWLAKNPPIIDEAVSLALRNNYSGYNIDFEPTYSMTELDAQKFAQFLKRFGARLHSVGKTLGVDIASWNRIWNFSSLGQDSGIDYVYDMDTYDWGKNWTRWEFEANKVVLVLLLLVFSCLFMFANRATGYCCNSI